MLNYGIYLRPCCQNKIFPGGDTLQNTIGGLKGFVANGMMSEETAHIYLERILKENCCEDCQKAVREKIEAVNNKSLGTKFI